jgi:iron complex outermembrane receptor protein
LSFQSGYRYPVIFEAYSNVNSGGVKRVGGLPVMSNGIFENAWLQTSITAFQAAVLKDMNQGGLSKNTAIEKNKGLLTKNPYTYIRPEHVDAIEAGYRDMFSDGRLFVDLDGYFSRYRNFIAQANMNVPKTSIVDSIPYYLYDNGKQDKYRMWTNSRTAIRIYGFSAGLRYALAKGAVAFVNGTYSKLSKASNEDGLEDGFNTPEWMVNAGVATPHLLGKLGAGMNLHGQSAYYWQSFLVNGNVPAYVTVDAHLTYSFYKDMLGLKLGASNLFNHYYTSFLGGPSIGGFYYLTLRYGLP